MKKHIFYFAVLLHSLSALAYAGEVGKGVLLVRYGAANTDMNYEKEDGYPNTLTGISVLCRAGITANTKTNFDLLVRSDTNRPATLTQGGAALSTVVINFGAKVVTDPLPGSPNHCLINGIKLSQVKGAWAFPLYTIP